jgi:hypothetical protein
MAAMRAPVVLLLLLCTLFCASFATISIDAECTSSGNGESSLIFSAASQTGPDGTYSEEIFLSFRNRNRYDSQSWKMMLGTNDSGNNATSVMSLQERAFNGFSRQKPFTW